MSAIIPLCQKVGKYMLIGDDIYERYCTDDVRVKAFDLGHGHLEIVGQRVYEYYELEFGNWTEDRARKAAKMREIQRMIERRDNPTDEQLEERRERSLKKAAARATTNARRLCKVMGANTIHTLTYRVCMTDLDLCKRHLAAYVRVVRKVLPDFTAVAAFEPQERGAWHIHLATHKVPATLKVKGHKVKSWNLLRSLWRGVTKELGGNFDASDSKPNQKRSAARIAAYISKYITKAFEDGEAYSNRWTRFGDCEVPRAVDLGTYRSMLDGVTTAYDLIEHAHAVVNQIVSKWGDYFFIVVEKPPMI